MKFKEFFYKYLNESKTFSYSSTQFDLDLINSKVIYDWGLKFIHDDVLDLEDGRQDISDIHVTILYGLLINDSYKVEPYIKLFSPFEIELGNIGLFKTENKDVVKIDIKENFQLQQLHKFLKVNIPNEYKFPSYSPHITVGYVKIDSCNHLEGNSHFNGVKMMIDKISFSTKEGIKTPIYFYPK